MTKYNINNMCRVVLTDAGVETLYKSGMHRVSYFNKDTKEFKTELWSLMQIFGSVLYNGVLKIPFENNEIEMI